MDSGKRLIMKIIIFSIKLGIIYMNPHENLADSPLDLELICNTLQHNAGSNTFLDARDQSDQTMRLIRTREAQ